MSLINFNPEDYPRATTEQRAYIEILSVDLCFDRKQRNSHIKEYISYRPITYLDELTKQEAYQVIQLFKKWKEERASK